MNRKEELIKELIKLKQQYLEFNVVIDTFIKLVRNSK